MGGVKREAVGKHLKDVSYYHSTCIPADLQPLLDKALTYVKAFALGTEGTGFGYNVVKFNARDKVVTLLCYTEFYSEAFPKLWQSCTIHINTGRVRKAKYQTLNKPVLHRKELLISPDHPDYDTYAKLTDALLEAGLLGKGVRTCGHYEDWRRQVREAGYWVVGHTLLSINGDK